MIKKIFASMLSASLGVMLVLHAVRVLIQIELPLFVVMSGLVTGFYGASSLILIIASWVSPKKQWISFVTVTSLLYLLFELYSTVGDVGEIGEKVISYFIMVLLAALIYWSIKTIAKSSKKINSDAPDATSQY